MKNSYLDRFHILSSFLKEKPYAFSLTADKTREIDNREFFERQVMDSTSYGGNFGFKNKIAPLGFSFNSSLKTIERASRPSQNFNDDEISFNLANESKIIGETRFDITQDEFSRTESGTADQKGTSRDFNLSNQKYLYGDNKKILNSYLHFYTLNSDRDSNILTLNERFDVEHSNRLNSSYNYNFSDNSSGGAKTQDNRVSANLRHRLYESLNSSANIYYFNSDSGTFSQNSYGLSLDENYTKKLGAIGKLSSGIGLNYSEEERKAAGGIISIIDESHTLTTGNITFLDKPRIDTGTVVVTDSSGITTYILNTDYQLSGLGERTQIQRIAGGAISNGQAVLVDYNAESSPLFNFDTLGENLRFRIDFLDEFIGVFYRLVQENHPKVSGEENAILQTLTDTAVGMDINYDKLKVEMEGEDYGSNLSPYKRIVLKEMYVFNPTQKSTLTFQSSQSKVRLIDTQSSQRFLDFISRYSVRLNPYSRFNTEAGFRWQRGSGADLNDISAGSGFEVNVGKFIMDAKYDFKRNIYLGDKLINHFFSTKIKRIF